MKNKYLHWVVICVIIGATFFCAQKLSQYNKNTNTLEEQILASGEIYETQNTNTIPANLSGTTSTDSVKPVFRPPNTEWKTRTITLEDGRTLTYEFGKGNPVALGDTVEKIQQENRECRLLERDDINDDNAIPRICREGMYGYVTPEVELALEKVLSDPRWYGISNLCSSEYQKSPYYNEIKLYLSTLGGLDISKFLIIDTKTGRKELDTQYIYSLTRALANAGNYSDDTGWPSSCMRAQGIEELYRLLQEPQGLYSRNLVDITNGNFGESGPINHSTQDALQSMNRNLDQLYFVFY